MKAMETHQTGTYDSSSVLEPVCCGKQERRAIPGVWGGVEQRSIPAPTMPISLSQWVAGADGGGGGE